MAGEYKATCGCKIHVIRWTSRQKQVSQESCPLHKNASELLKALKVAREHWINQSESITALNYVERTIAKAEGKQ